MELALIWIKYTKKEFMLEMKNHKICKKVLGQYSRRWLSKKILHNNQYLSSNDFRKKPAM